jgi:SAM-dependent methyltransferase
MRRHLNRCFPDTRRACPVCGWQGRRFRALDIGQHMINEIECPRCWSHDRHRLLFLALQRRPPAFFGKPGRILHFAPEAAVHAALQAHPELKCLYSDIDPRIYSWRFRPIMANNLHHLGIRDNCVDGIFISHVLEHVPDDRKALAECHRILKPGGTAVVLVPFNPYSDNTVEWNKPNPELFDHVRDYSARDFPERLHLFRWERLTREDILTPQEIQKYLIRPEETIFYCVKPA